MDHYYAPTLFQRPDKMSITQTFRLAHKARGKLSSEASRTDHNLRLLVGHANLLDSLMIHLSEAEAQQERWYQNTIQGYADDEEEETYGSLAADYESDTSESDSESEDEYEESPIIEPYSNYARKETVVGVTEVEEEDEYYDEELEDEDEDGFFPLKRTVSHRPPSLCSDVSDDEDEDATLTPPTSPPQAPAQLSKQQKIQMVTTSYYDSAPSSIHDHYHNPYFAESAPLIPGY